jgi:hypothetical protein
MKKTDIEWLEYVNEFHFSHHPEINIAIQHGIEALKKQAPQKPVIRFKISKECRFSGIIELSCPSCHAIYENSDFNNSYCLDCGQKLD